MWIVVHGITCCWFGWSFELRVLGWRAKASEGLCMISGCEVIGTVICVKDAILMLNSHTMTTMMPGGQAVDFEVIGLIGRLEGELSPVVASSSDKISAEGIRR